MRTFAGPDDVTDLIRAHFGTDLRVVGMERFMSGSKKGVYRLRLDDGSSLVAYVWHPDENFWPTAPAADPDDPFTDATGLDLFEAAYRRLVAIGVETPRVHVIDRSHTFYPADVVLADDVRGGKLEDLMARDRAASERPLALLRDTLAKMRSDESSAFGRVAAVGHGAGVTERRPEDVMLRRAMTDLAEAAGNEPRLEARHDELVHLLKGMAAAVRPRGTYGLVHGELGADHVMLDDSGNPLLIDIEGLAYFDVEWEHVFLKMRFHDDYSAIALPGLDPDRLSFYQLVRHLALVTGPLRIAEVGDFHDVAFMRELADVHCARALAFL